MKETKWKVGKHRSTVVSNTKIKNTNFPSPPNQRESGDDEPEHYGGYLICESVGSIETANLIAAAPELLESLKTILLNFKSCIDGGNGELETDKEDIKRAEEAIRKATLKDGSHD